MSKTTYHTPEKIVIVAGPSFGQALKFMMLGAVLGAGAVTYLKPKPAPQPQKSRGALQDLAGKFLAAKFDPNRNNEASQRAANPDAAEFEASTSTTEATEEVADRIDSLTSRLKSIGSRAKQLVETAGEAVKPTIDNALAEGKRVAAEVQSNLKKDVEEAGDKPAIAEQDGELPSEKEDKFVE
jgi:hypothetical protein